MNLIKKLLPALFILGLSIQQAAAQNAVAISSNPGPGLHVALNWESITGAVKYNIYRKNAGAASYPATPLNATPIQRMNNCATIKATLISGLDSSNWKMVAKSLADSVLYNPCNIGALATSSQKYKRLLVLAKGSMPVAIAAGVGYKDATVVNGTSYQYKIVGLNSSNTAVGNYTDLPVTAGAFTPLSAPATIETDPGDASVLVRWTDVAGAAGYIIERAPTAAGVYARVNESHFSAEAKNKLNGDTLIPSQNGFLDYKRYTIVHGKDSTHLVNGVPVGGPLNNSNYYYRISTIDLFGRAGAVSAPSGPVTPRDSTAPAAPMDISAVTDDVAGSVTVKWTQVVKDKDGHWEYPDSSIKYKLYRFSTSDDPNTAPSTYLGVVGTARGLKSKDTVDSDPNLRSTFGNRTWWYRVRAFDPSTNISQWSSAASAIVKDITPPEIVKNLVTKGYEDKIAVKWKPNNEPDMASYMVYRSLCHLGNWVECDPRNTCKEWQSYDPNKGEQNTNPNDREAAAAATGAKGNKLPCPCSGSFVFLGEITQDSVKRSVSRGNFFFEDKTIPAGSPLCYAYWIKAKDSSDNLSGTMPLPNAAERMEIKCERLRDLTPPEPALISGLFAQAEQVRVEWIGPPTQDTRAYHVYRADGTNPGSEPPATAYTWVGGMNVELPPTLPVVLAAPYTPPGMATCDKISVQSTPWMSQGYFEDKHIEPKKTYWYKVVGIDYDGNETKLKDAAAISTFSFSRKLPDAPVITTIDKTGDPCAVVLKWSPAYNPADHLGFIVYRSNSAAGPFIPVVVSPIKGNDFTDPNVVKGNTYWYTVTLLLQNGRMSPMSAAKSIVP